MYPETVISDKHTRVTSKKQYSTFLSPVRAPRISYEPIVDSVVRAIADKLYCVVDDRTGHVASAENAAFVTAPGTGVHRNSNGANRSHCRKQRILVVGRELNVRRQLYIRDETETSLVQSALVVSTIPAGVRIGPFARNATSSDNTLKCHFRSATRAAAVAAAIKGLIRNTKKTQQEKNERIDRERESVCEDATMSD